MALTKILLTTDGSEGGGERHAVGAQALANTRLRAARRLRRAYARPLARPKAAVLNP